MSYLATTFNNPSAEFVELCQSQVVLLTKGLKADWGIVYLTAGLATGEETNLIPIVVYPQTEALWREEGNSTILPEVWHKIESNSPSTAIALPEEVEASSSHLEKADPTILPDDSIEEKQQLVIPLIYEEMVVGLLVTGRKDREWETAELTQIEKIAKTIAIACILDRQKGWYEGQLNQQHQIQQIERDRLDDLLHQLRNPLTALRTFGKLLLKRLLPDDDNRSTVRGILRESDRLKALLEEFEAGLEKETSTLTLNATTEEAFRDRGSFLLPGNDFTLEPVEIEAILEPLLLSASAIARERDINLTANIPHDLPPIRANARALQEVLSNLIDNALKYTPKEGTIEIALQQEVSPIGNDWLDIEIRDTGYGIPSQDRDRIFERHYRGIQANSDIPGTGLGLAIAKESIEQMHGTIDLISPNPGSKSDRFPGTTCVLRLPIA